MTKEFSLLTQPIPSFPPNALSKIYSIDSDLQSRRYQFLIQKFQATYKRMPTFIARSPGRVNLIGEHVDYSGYSVMPMAIEKDVIMAFASFDPVSCEATIEIGNVDQRFPRRQFEHLGTKHCEIDSHEHEWSNYFKCGYKGVLDSVGYCTPKSIQIMMDGTVPAGGGLSSSSAFVCCSALVTMLAHNLEMDKGQLTKTAITGEQFAGVAIGGIFH